MIHFQKVTKKYGTHKALDNINCEIQAEEFVCIVGSTGAGKTTFLHLLIGADKPDEGSIQVDDFDLTKLNHHELARYRQKIGILFQDHKLLPKKTIYENVAFPLEMTNQNDAYIHARVSEVLHLVGMSGKEKKFPHEISGGEKQKVALARAIVGNPNLLVADEPTGNLDPKSTDELLQLFLKINKNGATVIIVTHNERIVNQIQKRVITLKEGKIASDKKGGYEGI